MAELNKIAVFNRKLCTLFYYCGLPNLWTNGITTTLCYSHFQILVTVILCFFIFSEWMSFSTQENLSEKQASDRIVFSVAHPVLFGYYFNVVYYKKQIAHLLKKLCITLKRDYNDPHVEMSTIKRNILYSSAYFSTVVFSLSSYGLDGMLQVIRSEGTFTTVVAAWPDAKDTSFVANILRVVTYLVWWALMIRVSAVYVAVTGITITISHQYKNLQSYFYSLNDLFDNSEIFNQKEQEHREKMYAEAIKLGIKMHNETLWCTKQCQLTCSFVYSGQIFLNVSILCMLMLQMVSSERTLANALASVATASAVLVSSGYLMWTAGDITVEAALLPSAIFYSGWHRCCGKSTPAIRRMLVIAMRQSQKPVVIRCFGIVELSYQSFLSIVKASYSAFSLLY